MVKHTKSHPSLLKMQSYFQPLRREPFPVTPPVCLNRFQRFLAHEASNMALGQTGWFEEHLHFRSHHQRGATPYRGTPPSSSSSPPRRNFCWGCSNPENCMGGFESKNYPFHDAPFQPCKEICLNKRRINNPTFHLTFLLPTRFSHAATNIIPDHCKSIITFSGMTSPVMKLLTLHFSHDARRPPSPMQEIRISRNRNPLKTTRHDRFFKEVFREKPLK
ncbi:hypothetical protein CEXT_692311 [Caerostris extrusa]|uniref:Uncharacterized protein n=1 Tax=Caerostris extrusa TaxID=172846 RepID=A0AAV4W619_CAEEX|nr:hypothetical protein CEXT_692311 [Caerostris extrusa]